MPKNKISIKIGDWVKSKNGTHCVIDLLNDSCECKISQVIYIYKKQFVITECFNQITLKHHLKGYEIEDIEKVDIK